MTGVGEADIILIDLDRSWSEPGPWPSGKRGRKDARENWGFQGNSLALEVTYEPGPVTMTHVIADTNGWRMLISEGEMLDTPPLNISESSMVVKMEKNVKQYLRELMKFGFAHHSIAAPDRAGQHLECLAGQLGIQVCRL